MVWEYFSRDGMSPIFRVIGTMTDAMYRTSLENNMLGQSTDRMPEGWIFQQDNDPKHKSKAIAMAQ